MSTNLPTPGTWAFDPTHTRIAVIARHMMVTKVHSTFNDFNGTITIGDSPETSSVEFTIDAASIDSGVADRDGHLRSPDFLDVVAFPTITFESTSVTRKGDDYALTGDLTIKGVTKPVMLELEYEGLVTDPYGNEKAAFSAKTKIDRDAWGLTWNVALETGGWLVSKELKVEVEAQAVRVDVPAAVGA